MPFSFRLDPATAARIRRLARQTGQSRSGVVREAVAKYDAREDPKAKTREPSALDVVRDFVGVVSSDGAQFSTNTHEKYRARLKQKHRGGRSR